MTSPTAAAATAATPSTKVTAPSSANPSTAEAIASTHGGATTSTKIGSLKDLMKKAPELYNKMMQGIATNICNEMKHHQDRLKSLMRKGSQE